MSEHSESGARASNERLLELVGELDHYAETEGYERGYPGGLYSGQRQRARAELEAGIRALTSHETRAPQRYALGAEGDICGAIPVMNEEAAGDWVHWGDVKHLFEANAQKANSCVCGEPNSPGTHRTDGPCLAPIGDRR